ncbi:hypothetical protein CU048_14645 [Beijerinckiaceae bacterium]|nr:hypothetical protein CU048_14645 [Beijerinckiaceae bacterium]
MEATPSNDWKPRIKVSKEAKAIAGRAVKLGREALRFSATAKSEQGTGRESAQSAAALLACLAQSRIPTPCAGDVILQRVTRGQDACLAQRSVSLILDF